MHRLYTLILICAALFLLAAPPSAAQLSASHQETFTVARPGTRIRSGTKAPYHQITWNTSGGPGACFLSLDYSTDGQVWQLGATIPGHDCTQSGSTIIAGPQPVQFVRVNVNALTNGGAVRTTYSGYQTNPGGPTGSVTSVFGRTGAIQAVIGDYSVDMITGAAPVFSPAFQGLPTAPTPNPGDSSNLVATTAFVAQAIAACGCGGGPGGGAVTSVFGRTGAVAALANDYSFSQLSGTVSSSQLASSLNLPGAPTAATAPVGTNTTQLATTAFVLANQGGGGGANIPGLSSDGTTLTFTGSGGFVTPKLNITQGPFYLESVTGALPALPGAGKNALTSGPDGWYFSNNNSAWALMGTGGGGSTAGVSSFAGRTGAVSPLASDYAAFFAPIGSVAAGVASFNSRTGAVNSAAGDYDVTQVTGAAPTNSPSLTGTPTSITPAASDDSTKIATTAWVKSQGYISTGPPPATSITQSAQVPLCQIQPTGTTNTLTISSGINIVAGDTVVVLVMHRSTSASVLNIRADVTDNGAGGGNAYLSRRHDDQAGTNLGARNILATDPGVAIAATSITITNILVTNASNYNGIFMACVYTYRGVSGFGNSTTLAASSAVNTGTLSLATDANSVMVAAFATTLSGAWAGNSVVSPGNPGPEVTQGALFHGLACTNTSPTPATVSCTWTFTGTAYQIFGSALELRCCAGAGGGGGGTTVIPGLFPQVVAFHKANITATTTAATDTPFMTCSATLCPPGYYRITWDFLSLGSGCTNGQVIVNVDYFDEYDLVNVYHTGIGSLSNIGPGRNHAYWVRMMTVAKPFSSTVGIQFTTSTTACSSGTGTAQQAVSVERLQ